MMVDRLIKKKHYISFTTNENGIIMEGTTQLLLQNILKLHVFLLSFTIYRSSLVISGVWKNLNGIFDISANIFTYFDSEIDRQSEIVNQEIERHFYIVFIHL